MAISGIAFLICAVLVVLAVIFAGDYYYDKNLGIAPRVQWIHMNHDQKYGRWTILDAYKSECMNRGRPTTLKAERNGFAQWKVGLVVSPKLGVMLDQVTITDRLQLGTIPFPHQQCVTYQFSADPDLLPQDSPMARSLPSFIWWADGVFTVQALHEGFALAAIMTALRPEISATFDLEEFRKLEASSRKSLASLQAMWRDFAGS